MQNGLYKMKINLVDSKKKHYLCTMKQELKKYLESETRKNEQQIKISEFALKLTKVLIIMGIAGIFIAYLFIEIL